MVVVKMARGGNDAGSLTAPDITSLDSKSRTALLAEWLKTVNTILTLLVRIRFYSQSKWRRPRHRLKEFSVAFAMPLYD